MSKPKKTSIPEARELLQPTLAGPKALVFISHDTRDAEYAEAFSLLLTGVTCGMLKSFRSSDKTGNQGLQYGTEWYPEIMKHLEQASDVVCLLTENSLGRPWLLYEAGVAKGKMDTPVHGLALGVPIAKASTGPFAQFQNCDGDAASVAKLVTQLAKRLPNADPPKDIVDQQVAVFLKKIEELVKKVHAKAADTGPKKADENTTVKLFEEVKVMFQELPERMESRVVHAIDPRRRSKRERPGLMELDYLMHIVGRDIEPATAWLVAISQFREDVPWAYELGMKVYRALDTGKKEESRRAIEAYRHTMRRLMHSPLGEELMNDKRTGMMLDHMLEILTNHLIDRMGERPASTKK